jgi:hypothetical protein
MAVFNEPARNGEYLLYDVPEFSREQVTFASGNTFVAGQLVKFSSSKIVPAVAADTTGIFVCYQAVNAASADVKGVITQRHSVVNKNLLTYPASSSGPQKLAHDAALLAAGIIVRA